MKKESKIKRLKEQATGSWEFIVSSIAPDLTYAIDKEGKHVPCPFHGGTDGFRVFKDFNQTGGAICNTCGSFADGFALLEKATDWPMKDILTRVDEVLNGYKVEPVKITARKPVRKYDDSKNTEKLRQVWVEAGKTPESKRLEILTGYLESRGLPTELVHAMKGVVRVHTALPYWVEGEDGKYKKLGTYAAMLSLMECTDTGEALTIHRTYLEQVDGKWVKANVPNPRRVMPIRTGWEWSSCAVKLGADVSHTLHIAEGIETALAVMAMGKQHCWAAISSTNIAGFVIPEGVKRLVIWADKDNSFAGQNAANALHERLPPDVELRVVFPIGNIPEGAKGIDWLDVYTSRVAA